MLINSPNISGSLTVTGNSVITGSLTVLGSITGAITGSATSASYVEYSNVANKPTLVSGSSQVTYSGLTGVPSGIVSGSSQVVYSGLTGVPSGIVSGSSQVTYSGLTGIPSGIVSGSAQIASFGIFATTGSNGFNGSQSITGSLTVTGQVVAQTLNVQQVTSSIVYSSGSNIFGNSLGNTQQFTGSVSVTGSLNTSIAAFGSAATTFLTSDGGTIKSRTAAQTLSDIAALPLAGGTLTGALNGTSAVFSGAVRVNGSYSYGSLSVLGTQGISWSSVGNDIAFGLATIGTATNGASLFIHTPAPVAGWTSGLGVDGTTDSSFLSTIQLTAYGLKFAGYNSKLVLRTSNGTSLTNALTLDGGNSGAATFSSSVTATSFIGEASATEIRLKGGGYAGSYNTSLRSIAGAVGILQFGNNGENYVLIGNTGTSSNTYLSFRVNCTTEATNSGTEAFRISSTGTGNSSAYFTGALTAQSTLTVSGAATFSSSVKVNGTPIATSGILSVVTSTSNIGATADLGLLITNDGTNGKMSQIGFGYSESKTGAVIGGIITSGGGSTSSALFFGTRDTTDGTTAPTERMRITSGGALLIGTTSSSGIGTGSSVNQGVEIGSGLISIQTNNNSNNYWSKATGYTSGDFTAHFVNSAYVGGISTNGSATNYATASDYRLKQDLKDFEGINLINKIKTYDYEWKVDNTRMFGIIAHELQEILPYAVTGEKDAERMQGVDYSKIVPILVKSIQELKAENDTLKSRIDTLEQA